MVNEPRCGEQWKGLTFPDSLSYDMKKDWELVSPSENK